MRRYLTLLGVTALTLSASYVWGQEKLDRGRSAEWEELSRRRMAFESTIEELDNAVGKGDNAIRPLIAKAGRATEQYTGYLNSLARDPKQTHLYLADELYTAEGGFASGSDAQVARVATRTTSRFTALQVLQNARIIEQQDEIIRLLRERK